jgi:PIN domain nuclease of toxin-antitoxin system
MGRERATPIVIDTCCWIWLASRRAKLSKAATEATSRAGGAGTLHLSAISCWEVAKLVEKGKLAFTIPVAEWIDRALSLDGLVLEPLSPKICVQSTQLPGVFHGDPADQLIVATARVLGMPVVTADKRMRDYAHVPSIW